MMIDDTIAAISTALGLAGISIIRISGKNAFQTVEKILQNHKNLSALKTHTIHYDKIINHKKIVDNVLISIFKEPHSYTGENVVEISCHGGSYVTQNILKLILQNGARLAQPGEFTKKAFLNGKLDLTEAEAVIDIISAKTKHSHESAINQLEGKLSKKINEILKKIKDVRIQFELNIDFFEEDIHKKEESIILENLYQIKSELDDLIDKGEKGIFLQQGFTVAIVGEPNAGKSSIFNKLVENERSIVTEIPGTTTDYIEEDIALDGYLIKIFDTAGLTKGKTLVESIGIERSYDIIDKANLLLWVHDISEQSRTTSKGRLNKNIRDEIKVKNKDLIEIYNKIDLVSVDKRKEYEGKLTTNALTGEGIDKVKQNIVKKIGISELDLSAGLISNTRQLAIVNISRNSINKAISSYKNKLGYEFTAFDLQQASESLEEVVGKITNEDMLNTIFNRFCIGK